MPWINLVLEKGGEPRELFLLLTHFCEWHKTYEKKNFDTATTKDPENRERIKGFLSIDLQKVAEIM